MKGLFSNPIRYAPEKDYNIYIGSVIKPIAHSHSLSEFVYMLDGCILIETPGAEYTISKGDIFFVNPHIPHLTSLISDTCEFIVLNSMQGYNFELLGDTKYLHEYLVWKQELCRVYKQKTPENEIISDIIKKIYNEHIAKDQYSNNIIYSYIELLNLYLLRDGTMPENLLNTTSTAALTIIPALKYINENYANQISISDISKKMHMSTNYFERLFKKVTTTTFTDYVNFVRTYEAKKLLPSTDISIGEIARRVGFSSQIYFNRCFKKYTACTPLAYRKLNHRINNR